MCFKLTSLELDVQNGSIALYDRLDLTTFLSSLAINRAGESRSEARGNILFGGPVGPGNMSGVGWVGPPSRMAKYEWGEGGSPSRTAKYKWGGGGGGGVPP